jgi:hypothetical protein
MNAHEIAKHIAQEMAGGLIGSSVTAMAAPPPRSDTSLDGPIAFTMELDGQRRFQVTVERLS